MKRSAGQATRGPSAKKQSRCDCDRCVTPPESGGGSGGHVASVSGLVRHRSRGGQHSRRMWTIDGYGSGARGSCGPTDWGISGHKGGYVAILLDVAASRYYADAFMSFVNLLYLFIYTFMFINQSFVRLNDFLLFVNVIFIDILFGSS